MGLVFGMDEAGYGPNLGPLVVTVTAWEVPGAPHDLDFWTQFAPIVARSARQAQTSNQLFIGDSKEVYTSARGLGHLEQAVLTVLGLAEFCPASFHQLIQDLVPASSTLATTEPWYQDDLALPLVCTLEEQISLNWKAHCKDCGITLRGIASDLVLTERYNQTVRAYGSKGLALSRMSLSLLRRLWNPCDDVQTLILIDKHGGRNRYDSLLAEVLDDQFIVRLEEGTARSRYRVNQTELWFQTKAEAHFPVAVSSMISKYLRELAMTCFNRYWQTHLPELKPTKGYPVDARRFREAIAEMQQQLGIADESLWRER